MMSSAPAHARCCQSSYGLIANWKMTAGRLGNGRLISVLQNWLLRAVNSRGAVSPLILAIPSNTPVMIPGKALR